MIDHIATTLSLTPEILKISTRWGLKKTESILYKTSAFILAKPQCYMNESGSVVTPLLKHHKLPPENLIVIQDDSDMLLGAHKLRYGGSSGGHRGIESLIQSLGTQQFWRLKIGIRPEHEIMRLKAERLVLKHIGEQERHVLEETITLATQHLFQEFKIPYPSHVITPL